MVQFRVFSYAVARIKLATLCFLMLLCHLEALATPIDLGELIQQITAPRYQITVVPTDPKQPIELETDAPAEELEIVEGSSVEVSKGKIQIQVYPGQSARISASVEALAGIRHVSNTTRIQVKPIAAGQSPTTHIQGDDFHKKLQSTLEFIEHTGKNYSSAILPAGIHPSPVLPVFMMNGTDLPPSSTSIEASSTALQPSPTSEVQPAVHQGGSFCPQSLIDVAGLCSMFGMLTVNGCCNQACSYSWMAAGIGAGILLGITLSVINQNTLYISVGVFSAAVLGAIGYIFGRLVDSTCAPCHSESKGASKQSFVLPLHHQRSSARQLAAIPEKEDAENAETVAENQNAGSQSHTVIVEVVIEGEQPDAEKEEAHSEANEEDKSPDSGGHRETGV